MNFQEEEEPPRPEYLIKLAHSKFRKRHRVSGQEEPFVPFWRRRVPIMAVSFSVMLFLVSSVVMCLFKINHSFSRLLFSFYYGHAIHCYAIICELHHNKCCSKYLL